jgi:serine protease Do
MSIFSTANGLVDAFSEASNSVVNSVRDSLVIVKGQRHGAGAGIVWNSDGIILSNSHVVNGRDPQVLLPDGRQLPALLIARDNELDLALLSVDCSSLPAAQLAPPGSLKIGMLVFAIGHPWGQRGYVTAGVLSSIAELQTRNGRKLPVLRTDAALAPGNSGGPLVNARGAVLGINTMIVGGDQGVAIPIGLIREFSSQVLGKVQV